MPVLKGKSVPVPRGKTIGQSKFGKVTKGKLPPPKTQKTQPPIISKDAEELNEMLDVALEAKPTSFDSLGNGYYLGPTVGQILSWYYSDRKFLFMKIEARLREGLPIDMVFIEFKEKNPELRRIHIEYVKKRMEIDDESHRYYKEEARRLSQSKGGSGTKGLGDSREDVSDSSSNNDLEGGGELSVETGDS